MNKFAKLWPDTLSKQAVYRDLEYEPHVSLPGMVAQVLNAHSGRKLNSKAAFRSIDTCEAGIINDYMLEKYIRRYLVRGREKHEYTVSRRQDIVGGIVIEAMKEMDVDSDGEVSRAARASAQPRANENGEAAARSRSPRACVIGRCLCKTL